MSQQHITFYGGGSFVVRDAAPAAAPAAAAAAAKPIPGSFVVPASGPFDMTPPAPTGGQIRYPGAASSIAGWTFTAAGSASAAASTAAAPPQQVQMPQPAQLPSWAFSPPAAVCSGNTGSHQGPKPDWTVNAGASGSNIVWRFN